MNGDGCEGQYSCRRQLDEDEDHLAADWDRTVAGVKEQAFARLQEELSKAHQELRLRDEEVNRLSRVREEVEAELEDLTASLFQVGGPLDSRCISRIILASQRRCIVFPVKYELNLYTLCRRK
jgi:hypothetical protein